MKVVDMDPGERGGPKDGADGPYFYVNLIDYIKNGRPKYDGSDIVFLKHMSPFDPISDNDHLEQRIIFHMNKAGIRRDKNGILPI